MSEDRRHVTYQSYLKIPELLSLQRPRSEPEEHDEMLFIVIHQVYELWFKVVLHELDQACHLLVQRKGHEAGKTLRRVLKILKTLVSQIDILETMTPVEFESFRDRLDSASGFQSVQFRELEFLLGQKRPRAMRGLPAESAEKQRLEQRYGEPSLWDVFLRFLANCGYEGVADALERDVTAPAKEDPAVQEVLVHVYRNDPIAASLCERLVDLDEGMQEWRYRHVKMVERTIGTKVGTGGSAGVEYLRTTLDSPAFPDLWAVRATL